MKFLPKAIFRSLRVKFGLLILVLLFLVFSVSSGILIYRSINTQRDNLISQARAFAKLSAKPIGSTHNLYYESGYLKFQELMREILSLNTDVKRTQIISVRGEVLFDSDQLELGKPSEIWFVEDKNILDNISSNLGSEIPLRTKNSQPMQIIEPYFEDFGARPFSILYFISYDSISQNVFSTILTTLLLSSIFLIGSILLIVLVVDRTILNPIEIVIQGARKISAGHLSHTIEVKTKDEVGDLASAVNQMAATLKKNIEDLRELDKLKDEFVSLASHNLRTPLTVIKGYINSLQKNKSLDLKAKEEVNNVAVSTKQLEAITESLLSLVTLEKGRQLLTKTPVDLGQLLEEVSGKFSKKVAEKRISFIFELPSEPLTKVELDKKRINQAFTGLIDNAVKFNKDEGKVIIKLEKKGKEVIISIKDTGIGISKEESTKVFKKFHRATDVLTYNYEGIGLGLYLTKLIIESHQGKIWFESTVGEGSTFYVSLPLTS